jgi:hypothetical protein
VNYLAHAYRHLERPYFVAGTALPDWMSVIDRKNRARRQYAEPVVEHADADFAELARGVLQHHHDDRWFHENPLFVALSARFAGELRELLAPGMGHQAGFVGHISVELLLDAYLIKRDTNLLDSYYQLLEKLDPQKVQRAADAICPRPVNHLELLLPRFIDERFLDDYVSDSGLLYRLNGVMRRVKLPSLPHAVQDWLGSARAVVNRSADHLLVPHKDS